MKSMSTFGMKNILVIVIAAAMELVAVRGWAADAILSSRLMYVPFDAWATVSNYRVRLFSILDQKGMEKGKGTALSNQASEVAELPLYGRKESESIEIYAAKWFPTGGEGQAVAFPVDGNWKDGSGSLAFWVKGTGWDVTTPQAEELITLERRRETSSSPKRRRRPSRSRAPARRRSPCRLILRPIGFI